VGETNIGISHLSLSSGSVDLLCEFDELSGSGRTDWMSFRLQATAWVDRYLASQSRSTLPNCGTTIAIIENSDGFGGDDFCPRKAIVNLTEVDI
jgi:hypothetical protein